MNFTRILTMSVVGLAAGLIAFNALEPKGQPSVSQTNLTAQASAEPARMAIEPTRQGTQKDVVPTSVAVQPDVAPTPQVVQQDVAPVTQDQGARDERDVRGDDPEDGGEDNAL